MKPIEIVGLIKKKDPGLLGRVPEKRAARIVMEAFVQLRSQLNAMNEGVIKVAGLGSFRVRQGEQEKDGKKITVKRTNFMVAREKSQSE